MPVWIVCLIPKLLESKRRRAHYSRNPRGAPLLRGFDVTTSQDTWLPTWAYLQVPMSSLPLTLPPVALELRVLGTDALGQGRSDPFDFGTCFTPYTD